MRESTHRCDDWNSSLLPIVETMKDLEMAVALYGRLRFVLGPLPSDHPLENRLRPLLVDCSNGEIVALQEQGKHLKANACKHIKLPGQTIFDL